MTQAELVLSLLAAMLAAFSASAATVSIAADRMAEVDGKRMFILGLYENPADDAVLDEVAAAGFNLVRAAGKTEALDRLHRRGLGAWINTGSAIDLSVNVANKEQSLREMVDDYAQHPALYVWEVPDEALWNCWYSAVNWRRGIEPSAQRKLVDALTDKALAAALRKQRDQANELYHRGDFAAGEELADDIWRKLGKESSIRNISIANSRERADKMCGGMKLGYDLLRKIDPAHPVWMNHAPRNQIAQLAAFNEGADIVGCDIYPVPVYKTGHSDLYDRSLSAAGSYTRRMQEAAPGKPVWMVLQGFGWADLDKDATEEKIEENPRPTLKQSRFMAYNTIVRGARGILYWGTAYIEKDSELWKNLMILVRELAGRQPLLSAPDSPIVKEVTLAQTWGSVDRGVEVLAKDVDGKTWFIVANEYPGVLTYTLHGLEALNGTTYADAEADREATVQDGTLSLTIRGQGIQILAPQPERPAA